MTNTMHKRVSYDIGCMKSLRKLPDRVAIKFMDLMTKYMSDPSANGLNLETVEGSKDSAIKSLRVDQGYRAIAFVVGRDIMFVHVNEHDKAYRWASGRRVKLDPETNRIRVIEEVDAVIEPVATTAQSAPRLLDDVTDTRLRALGVPEEELTSVRRIETIEALEAAEDHFDPLTYQILYALAAGYEDEEIQSLTGVGVEQDAETQKPPAELTFGEMIETEQSRQTIFIPETEAELRRVFEEGLEGWRVFLHPEQRKLAYGRRASMSSCGINVRGRSKRLRLNYRTTQEIRAWAVSVLEGVSVDDLDDGTDTLRGYVSLLRGVAPELVGCRSEAEELDGLVDWVWALPPDQIRLSDIGVLCARRADADRVQAALRAAGIETVMLQSGADDRSVPGVRITTMHRAKGLEFFAVAIPFLSDTAFPPQGALRAAVDAADKEDIVMQYRSLLHVAATRAKKALRVSWSGEPTSLMTP
jgi:hypothetical protein